MLPLYLLSWVHTYLYSIILIRIDVSNIYLFTNGNKTVSFYLLCLSFDTDFEFFSSAFRLILCLLVAHQHAATSNRCFTFATPSSPWMLRNILEITSRIANTSPCFRCCRTVKFFHRFFVDDWKIYGSVCSNHFTRATERKCVRLRSDCVMTLAIYDKYGA